ncbi:hypothetical protein G6O69_07475 [Pseudenhygromyxa sp. WMMC2535]|uniref:hypothetical protein n=1 Tax=Pseudenhygromyxa sp. WMMC2535 TaxID=2712867 RepID=UPI001558324A|nr:hypothetical protein [Pseudenhygromyxa sp. WMMC2535]NVB37668.1 hypothetical protein [Pseudenhygromyxa sp. WMMC2535]
MHDIELGLSDDDYWNDPNKTQDAVIDGLWALNRDAIAIGAPAFVSLQARETLPLVVYRGASYRELWALGMLDHGQIVAVDLEHNHAYVGPVIAEEEAVRKKKLNPAEAPAGQGSESRTAELRGDLGLAWQPSTYVVTVLLREHASNRVRVELGKQAGAYHDEEVAKFIAEQRAQPKAPAVMPAPGNPVPSYGPIEGSPALPEALGIEMAGDRVVVQEPGARAILRGAFRLPALPAERSADGSAVVGITLVVNASDNPQSGVARLQVPAQEVREGIATGFFAIDLIAEGLTSGPQTYFVFAFSGEAMAGPTPVGIVDKSML